MRRGTTAGGTAEITEGWTSILVVEDHAEQAIVADFLVHYHEERNHQGLDNRMIEPGEEVGRTAGEIACRERLGGMLRYYYRKAA